jgi:hypothetical protein
VICGLVIFAAWACGQDNYFKTVQVRLNVAVNRQHGGKVLVCRNFHVQPFGDYGEVLLCGVAFGGTVPDALSLF